MAVAVYCRVSSEDQAERGTIENQVIFAEKYIDLHQLDVYKIYKEDGVSGTIPLEERPEGLQLIEDAKNKLFDTLLIYKLDRLGRSARITLNSIHLLEELGIQIKSMTEPFDTSSPSGRFMITMLAGVADLERETILERMWHGANRAAKDGKWLGGIVPYGYIVNDDGYLEINETPLPRLSMSEADIIRLIFNLITQQGFTTIKAADYLNALEIPTAYVKDNRQIKKGKRKENTAGIWRPARIRGIIYNSVYMGIHYYGKRSNKKRELIPREVPAIISPEVWQKAQEVLKSNQIEAMKNSTRRYLLRGLIKCKTCGLSYQGKAFRGAKKQLTAYYVCGGKNKYMGPLQGKCDSKNIPQKYIEDLVWNDIINFINNPGDALKELDTTLEEKSNERNELQREQSMLINSLNDKQNEKQSILDIYRKKLISVQDLESQLNKIAIEVDTIEKRIKEIEEKINSSLSYEEKYKTIEYVLSNLREKIKEDLTFEEKREIVKSLIKEINIETTHEENRRPIANISIVFNFSNVVNHTDVHVGIMDTN